MLTKLGSLLTVGKVLPFPPSKAGRWQELWSALPGCWEAPANYTLPDAWSPLESLKILCR